jgi:hypothetical protein
MEAVTELHGKSLIQMMNGSLEHKRRRRQQGGQRRRLRKQAADYTPGSIPG